MTREDIRADCKICKGTGVETIMYRECMHDPRFDGEPLEFQIMPMRIVCRSCKRACGDAVVRDE